MRLSAGLAAAVLLVPALLLGTGNDVGIDSIVRPRGTVDSGTTVIPVAIARNHGTAAAAFDVTMTLGTDYRETVIETLPAGSAGVIVFPSWFAAPVGALPVVAYTALTGDENPGNDTVIDSVVVVRLPEHDVLTVDILSPPVTLRAGETVTPMGLIRNRGAGTERYFDVRFRIPPLYDQTVTVESLPAYASAPVAFPDWTPTAGFYQVSCSTQLAGDEHPENDRQQVSIQALRPLGLFIERDQSGIIRAAETRNFEMYAEIQGDNGAVIAVPLVLAPQGWDARVLDSTGTGQLGDGDGDGIPDLGYLNPGTKRTFFLQVHAPAALVGNTIPSGAERFVVQGFAVGETLAIDSAVVTLALVPNLEIHNFPNPLEDDTRFVIGLPESGTVSLSVYDRSAQLVAHVLNDRELAAGPHVFRWTATTGGGSRLAPGTYVYILEYTHGDVTDAITSRLVISRE